MAAIFADMSPEISEQERKNGALVRSAAGGCTVLLENDGTLPLKEPCRIALYGHGARNTVKGGTGSGEVNSRFVVNIEEGLRKAGFTVTTGEWLDAQEDALSREKAAYMRHMEERARREQADMVTLMMGEPFVPATLVPLTEEQILSSDTDTAIYVLDRKSVV